MQFQKCKKDLFEFSKMEKRNKFKITKNAIFGLKKHDFWIFPGEQNRFFAISENANNAFLHF